MNESRSVQSGRFPLLAKEGWPRHKEMVPFRKGADGVVAHKLCFGMRFETCLVVDGFLLMAAPYLQAARCRACASRRACAGSARRLRRCGGFATLLLMPQPPLLCKEGKVPALNGS